MKDLHNNLLFTKALAPVAAVTNDTAFVSDVLTRGMFEATEFVGVFGSIADADVTFTVLVEDSDDNITFAAVDDVQLLGVEAMGLQFDSDGKTFKIGYTGIKKYVRVTITPANNSGNIFLAAVWIEGFGRRVSTAQVH